MAHLPLPEAIDEYLAWLELDRHSSPGTIKEYSADLRRFVDFSGGAAAPAVGDIDRDLLRAYQRHLSQRRADTGRDRRLSVSTRARRLVALRSFLRFAAREEWLPGDLGTAIDVPKLPERLPKPLEAEGRDRLIDALPTGTPSEKRDRAFVLFMLSTGCRISEALQLDRAAWNPERQTVIGKGNRERVVTVTDRARQAVDDYLAMRRDPSPALWIGFHHGRAGTAKNRLTVQGAHHLLHQLAMRLGIPKFHPHQLRHTLGTWLQETTGDARLTAETLGHRGLGSVAGYTKITDARRREAYERMEKAGL